MGTVSVLVTQVAELFSAQITSFLFARSQLSNLSKWRADNLGLIRQTRVEFVVVWRFTDVVMGELLEHRRDMRYILCSEDNGDDCGVLECLGVQMLGED